MNTKIKVLIAGVMAVMMMGCDGTVDSNSYPLVQPTHEYEIDTWGYNSEVYEFIPKSNANMVCVMLMLDSGVAVGLQCFPKAINNDI